MNPWVQDACLDLLDRIAQLENPPAMPVDTTAVEITPQIRQRMKRHPHPSARRPSARLLAIVLPLGSVCGQDSLEVTFVGDRELEVREVVKPASTPTRVDLGMAKPTIDYAPIAKSIAPVTQVRTIEPFAVRMDAHFHACMRDMPKVDSAFTPRRLPTSTTERPKAGKAAGVSIGAHSSAGSTGQVDSLGAR